MRPKLTDVAKKAGVSPTTVSRVINNYGYLSEKTKEKVYQAMEELNYQPNSLARSLHGKQTNLIGVIMPDITNPFFAELVAAIEKKLFEKNYKMILCNANYDKHKEQEYLKMLIANQVDGIITGTHNLDIEEYNKVGLPIISFDRKLSDQIPIVSCDNYQGGCLATDELYQAGCHHIDFFGNPQSIANPTNERLKAYQDTIQKLGLKPHIHAVRFSESPALKAVSVRHLLEQHTADGIFCSDDLTALLVLQEAAKMNIQIPQQLKVIGFDGTKLIQTYHPELSTIVQPISEIADLLTELLCKRIENKDFSLDSNQFKIPVKILRSSSTQRL
ncbi:LacI family DNA-binding transcriptional regulator [Ligilactobacillus sp. LYQ135]